MKRSLYSVNCLGLLTALAALACDSLQGDAPLDGQNVFVFAGAKMLLLEEDGAFTLVWDSAPFKEPVYSVFQARKGEPFDFTRPISTTDETRYQTEALRYAPATCFVVRMSTLTYTADRNENAVCTDPAVYNFPGLTSVTIPSNDGKILLQWAAVPEQRGRYDIYEVNSTDQLSTQPVATTTETQITLDPYYLGVVPCFVVRYFEKGRPADNNMNKLCAEKNRMTSFSGIETLASTRTGEVDVTWFPANHNDVSGYNIYRGDGFESIVKTVLGREVTSVTVTQLPAGQVQQFSVRAFTSYGTEDTNTRMMTIDVVDLNPPDFDGVAQVELVAARKVRLSWTPIASAKEYVVYRGVGPAGTSPVVDWNTPFLTVKAPASEVEIERVGDDLDHSFGVHAVTRFGIADVNRTVKTITMPESGAPLFDGVVAAAGRADGKVAISWGPAVGQTRRYLIYRGKGSLGSVNLAAEPFMVEPYPSTTVIASGFSANETYTFVVRAEDSRGNIDANMAYVSLLVGHQSLPVFHGYLAATGLSETAVSLQFMRNIEPEIAHYRVQWRRSGATIWDGSRNFPKPARYDCTGANPDPETGAYNYDDCVEVSDVRVSITGLQAKLSYDFRVRPVDVWGNESDNTEIIQASTLDQTPPTQFTGITEITQDRANVRLDWVQAIDTDIASYAVYWAKFPLRDFVASHQTPLQHRGPLPLNVYRSALQAGDADSFTVPTLEKGLTWYFAVGAIDDVGNEHIPCEVNAQGACTLIIDRNALVSNSPPSLLVDGASNPSTSRTAYIGESSAEVILTALDADLVDQNPLRVVNTGTSCPVGSIPILEEIAVSDIERAAQSGSIRKYRVTWSPAGPPIAQGDPDAFLLAGMTTRSCSATYAVGDSDIPTTNQISVYFTANNRSPVVSSIAIIPPEGETFARRRSIRCSVSAVDSDIHDSLTYQYAWSDGSSFSAPSADPVLPPPVDTGAFPAGSRYRCMVYVDDGHIATPVVGISEEHVFTNTPPENPIATLADDDNNSPLLVGQKLRCDFTAFDEDNDPLSFGAISIQVSSNGSTGWLDVNQAIADCASPQSGRLCFEVSPALSRKYARCRVAWVSDGIATPLPPFFSGTQYVDNSDPVLSSVVIIPASDIEVGERLVCAFTADDPDLDSFDGNVEIRWTANGAVISGATLRHYDVSLADRNKVIRCAVRFPPNADGHGSRLVDWVTSTNLVTYENSTPTVDSVSVTPTGLHPTSTLLTCEATMSDPDGDFGADSWPDNVATVLYQWIRDGVNIVGATSRTYSMSASDRGKLITCRVSLAANSDGFNAPAVAGRTSVNSASAINSSPIIASVTISGPVEPRTGDTLDCSSLYFDPDGDVLAGVTYYWRRDGTVVASGVNAAAYIVRSVDRTRQLSCGVELPRNADGFGSLRVGPVYSEVTVPVNSNPTVTDVEVRFTAGTPYPGSRLSCAFTANDVDGDISFQRSFKWFRAGAEIVGATANTYTVISQDRLQAITCRVIVPENADGWGSTGFVVDSSNSLTPQNRAPRYPSSGIFSAGGRLSPDSPYLTSTLVCSGQVVDDDNDAVTWTIMWYVGGSLVHTASSTGYDVSAQLTPAQGGWRQGDTIRCQLKASDGIAASDLILPELSVVAVNRPPTVTNLVVSPTTVYKGTNSVTCGGTPVDADGDTVTVTYKWYKGATEIFGETSATLTSAAAGVWLKGNEVYCEMSLNDGYGDVNYISPIKTVANSNAAGTLTCSGESTQILFASSTVAATTCSGITDGDGDPITYERLDVGLPGACPGSIGVSAAGTLNGSLGAFTGTSCTVTISARDNHIYNDNDGRGDYYVYAASTDSIEFRIPFGVSLDSYVEIDSSCDAVATARFSAYQESFLSESATCDIAGGQQVCMSNPPITSDLGGGKHELRFAAQPDATGTVDLEWSFTGQGATTSNTLVLQRNLDVFSGTATARVPYSFVGQEGVQSLPAMTGNQADGCSAQPCTGLQGSLAAGPNHSCVVTETGGLSCWGSNATGELGRGTVAVDPTVGALPDAVLLPAGYKAWRVAVGGKGTVNDGAHTCAILYPDTAAEPVSAGSLYCWGANDSGQLGLDPNVIYGADEPQPVGVGGNVVAVDAGEAFTCVVLAETTPGAGGGIRCFGAGGDGQLGDALKSNSWQPRTPVGFASAGAAGVSLGRKHVCALTVTGGVRCWGDNYFYQVGNGNNTDQVEPQLVSGLTGVRQVAAGEYHSCALVSDGTLWCWGDGSRGKLGNGSTTFKKYPTQVVDLQASVASVSAGDYHTCAVLTDATAWCWGYASQGILGYSDVSYDNGTTIEKTRPVRVVNSTDRAAAISAGRQHTCLLMYAGTSSSQVKCFGGQGSAIKRLGITPSVQYVPEIAVSFGDDEPRARQCVVQRAKWQ